MATAKHHINKTKNLIGFFHKALLWVFVLILGCGIVKGRDNNICISKVQGTEITSSGALRNYIEGDTLYAFPGFMLAYLVHQETQANKDAARNFMIAIGTGGIGFEGMMAAKGAVLLYRIGQITVPIVATITTAPGLRESILETPGGDEFISAINPHCRQFATGGLKLRVD